MKAEERHELKENDLASWLQYGFPIWLKNNGSYVLLVLALGFLGFQVWRLYEARQEGTRIKASNELRMAQEAEDVPSKLKTLIETYDIKDVREKAYLALGKAYVELLPFPGQLKAMNLTRSEALTEAYNAYEKALKQYGSDELIAGKAMLGMAQVEEDRGEWDQAKKIYEEMGEKGRFSDPAWANAAAAQLKTLEARKNAPRLVSQIKIPPPTMPSTSPAGGGPGPLPGAFGTMPGISMEPPKSAPASAPAGGPTGLPGAGLPFGPGAGAPATGAAASAPATGPR